MKIKVQCDWCGKTYEKQECCLKGKAHHFCCRQCLWDYSSKSKNPNGYAELKDLAGVSRHMTDLNREMNPERMTPEVKEKLRAARLGKGECHGYSKIHSRAAHRVVAEQMLGRKLQPGEVVHHRDGNRYNNDPANLQVFPSNAAHTRFHSEYRWFLKQLEKMEACDE